VRLAGRESAEVTGKLSLRGVTAPVTLHVTFNGGYPGHPLDPNARLGFSAEGSLSRSAFGMSVGVPEPPSTLGVGDMVRFTIEAEMTGPAWEE
jgi:polyisoprenoid-binding protein YceI